MTRPANGAPTVEDLDRADRLLTERYDANMAEAYRRGGEHLVCRAGCTECCVGPFAISPGDARRLRRGLATLPAETASEIRRRAQAAADQLRPDFPGDPERGILQRFEELGRAGGGEVRTAEALEDAITDFLDRHAELACPALDPSLGHCQLYTHRPLSCRAYGPPLVLGDEPLEACHLCFREASEETLEACRLDPDPEGLEDTILDALDRHRGRPEGDTLIAFALALPADPG